MAVGLSRWVVGFLCLGLLCAIASAKPSLEGTIIFSTYRRLRFGFDIFCVEIPSRFSDFSLSETRLTHGYGQIVNYNGFFASSAEQDLIFKKASPSIRKDEFSNLASISEQGKSVGGRVQKHETFSYGDPLCRNALDGKILAFVSEHKGRPQVYFKLYICKVEVGESNIKKDGSTNVVMARMIETAALHTANKNPVYGKMDDNDDDDDNNGYGNDEKDDAYQPVFYHDRPSIAHGCVIYVSSQEMPKKWRQSWAAIYSTNLTTGLTTRLTPVGVADFSPSVSPSGEWVLVASYGNRTWDGIQEMRTDLYIFNSKDGSQRTLLVSGGGWPSWADDSTFFFHRKAEDGWWSIYKGTLSPLVGLTQYTQMEDVIAVERVTPVGIHCFTPAASATMKWVAVATHRPESVFRHIEIYDLLSNSFFPVTNLTTPTTHHYNPFVSHDSTLVGYHKCRGCLNEDAGLLSVHKDAPASVIKTIHESLACRKENDLPLGVPHLDSIVSPFSSLSLLRTDGEFPSFSPDGSLIAYIRKAGETGIRAMRSDGSGSTEVYANSSFGTVWDRVREGVIYTSSGPIFHSQASVHIVAIYNVHKLVNGDYVPLVSKILTKEGTRNNAFPSPSPDGNYVVFRSSRSGWKNLYIMDAVQGEEGGLRRLTAGKWTDTMCSWSPDGEWIVFSSDRDNPKSGSFQLYLIHPNGTGLHKVFSNVSVGGRANHASFSPDSKTLLFATDYAGLSSEPISLPFQFQPNGDIYVASLDGKYLERLTHLQYENGTPSWGVKYINSSDLTQEGEEAQCSYDDIDPLTNGFNALLLQMPYGLPTQALCSNAG